MRHPFASVQYYASSLSSDEDEEQWPDRKSNEALLISEQRLALPLAQARHDPRGIATQPGTSLAYFVQRSREVAVQLGGQEPGAPIPVYRSGGTIDGVITIFQPDEVLSLDVQVHGQIRIREVAGSGTVLVQLLHDLVYSWNCQRDAPLGTRCSFQYTLPSAHLDATSGERRPLPPTYQTHLAGIPGFTMHVSYQITVDIVRGERKAPLWRKRSCLRVPFAIQQYSRPPRAGPFRLSPAASREYPRTLFTYTLGPRRLGHSAIELHVFLPMSQICSLKEPIPFFVTLFADEDVLSPFTCYRPAPSSFHPLSSPSHTSLHSVSQQLISRTGIGKSGLPLQVHMKRTTAVDVLCTGVPQMSQSSHIFSSQVIGQGVVHKTSRNARSITWAGAVTLSANVRNGGFEATGVRVSDGIVVCIKPPDGSRTPFKAFCETIPVRLTTESHACSSAASAAEA
ncbi:uncharacterized protein LAESUDRAFT_641317 [Laetiporus sulphureus 93-53]|uniref:Arrestin-like N-terminal domain-containing protein n=1 Tax=Laetiporus sulphureus 93-53 TaxID=1314785 RepID=A0A165HUR2_9APHY|nr:uncharacterized protein LAESUDRAFT_641317 [Laetiporus sulphureus 93-53]KZT12214.1 hypothetical protein LAESUDRAFT_641317 [Laetiporus sulphureus 93-53]